MAYLNICKRLIHCFGRYTSVLKLGSPYSPVAVILVAITLVLKHCTGIIAQ